MTHSTGIKIPDVGRGKGPLTEREFKQLLADANGIDVSQVEIGDFTPIDDAEYLTRPINQLKEDQGKTMRISHQLRNQLQNIDLTKKVEQNLIETNRETELLHLGSPNVQPERYTEICYFFKGYPIAIANDKTAWVYEDDKWSPLGEMSFPGLPQPGR